MSDKKDKTEINRRHFLQTTAAAGASLMISPMAKAQDVPKGSDDLNIALIGTGAQGQVLLNACLKIPNIRFKAVCDIWTDYNQKRAFRLLKKYGHDLNAYEDYRKLLANEKDLDGVIIATPDFWHARHTIATLRAGHHVYCEKEMANTLDDAKKMVRAARETDKLLQIGHQRQFRY